MEDIKQKTNLDEPQVDHREGHPLPLIPAALPPPPPAAALEVLPAQHVPVPRTASSLSSPPSPSAPSSSLEAPATPRGQVRPRSEGTDSGNPSPMRQPRYDEPGADESLGAATEDDISDEEFGDREVVDNFVVDYSSLPLHEHDAYLDLVSSMCSPPDASYFLSGGLAQVAPYNHDEKNQLVMEVALPGLFARVHEAGYRKDIWRRWRFAFGHGGLLVDPHGVGPDGSHRA